MRTETFFIRVWRLISTLGFVLSLFSSHVSYPGEVAVRFNSLGQAVQYINRDVLFYSVIAIFLIVNVLVNAVVRLFPKIPMATLTVPHQPIWADNRAELNTVFTNWFYGLMCAVNTILALGLFVLSLLNRSTSTNSPESYVWLLPMSMLILISVIAALPIRLLMKPRFADA